MAFENLLLVFDAQTREQRQYFNMLELGGTALVFAQVICHIANLTFAGQKHQNIAIPLPQQIIGCIQNRLFYGFFFVILFQPARFGFGLAGNAQQIS